MLLLVAVVVVGIAQSMIRDDYLNRTFTMRRRGEKLTTDWSVYQLSDAFRLCLLDAESKEFIKQKEMMATIFPGSIVAEILARHTSVNDAESLLESIVRERARKTRTLPSPDSLTVHLRVGDVLDDPSLNLEDDVFEFGSSAIVVISNVTKEPTYPYKVRPVYKLAVYNTATRRVFEAAENALPEEIDTINIMAYLFHSETDQAPTNHQRSEKYRDSVVEFFRERRYRINARPKRATPDDDFVFMASSRFYLPSGGSFGMHACTLVERFGGECLRFANVEPYEVDMTPDNPREEKERVNKLIGRLKTQTLPLLRGDRYRSKFVWSNIHRMTVELDQMLDAHRP